MTRLSYGAFGANSLDVDGMSVGQGSLGVNVQLVASPFTGGGPYALAVSGDASLYIYVSYPITMTNARGYYLRARVRISGTPTANTLLLGFGLSLPSSTSAFGIYLESGSRVARLWAGAALQGAAGPTLAVNTDYVLEVYALYNQVTTLLDTVSARVDGVVIDTVSGAFTTTSGGGIFFGLSAGAGITAHYTDWAVNDDQGANNNSWPGDARVAMLLPVSDDTGNSTISADAWRLVNVGTTNLYTGVDNTPPTGIASPGSGTSQIVVDTPSVSRAYTCVTATYDSALASGDTITHVQGVFANGEAVNTGTKTGTCDLQANPVGSSTSFTFGNDVGADGTFPTNWSIARTLLSLAPTPTRSTGASLRVFANSSTRSSDVCFMGVYVEYQLAVAAAYAPPPFQRRWRYLNRRRSA